MVMDKGFDILKQGSNFGAPRVLLIILNLLCDFNMTY